MIVRPFVVSSEEGLTLPQFSPDGKTLLASSETFDAVYLLSTSEPGQATLLQSGTGVGYYPRWSPDGRCVEVRHAGQRRHDVPHDSVPVDTAKCGVPRNSTPGHWVELDDESVYLRVHRQRRKISPDGDRFCCAVLSPSGRMVSFQGLDGGLYLYDWDTDKLQGLGVAHHPSFSAKGRFLVFDRCFDNGKELVACTIELMDLAADSRSPRTILGTPNLSRHPSLSSDHRRISFESQGQLWVGELVLEP
jgi:WD40 repeat protein